MFHPGPAPAEFMLPTLREPVRWRILLDTRQDSPNDIFPALDGPLPPRSGHVTLDHHSMIVFISDDPLRD